MNSTILISRYIQTTRFLYLYFNIFCHLHFILFTMFLYNYFNFVPTFSVIFSLENLRFPLGICFSFFQLHSFILFLVLWHLFAAASRLSLSRATNRRVSLTAFSVFTISSFKRMMALVIKSLIPRCNNYVTPLKFPKFEFCVITPTRTHIRVHVCI